MKLKTARFGEVEIEESRIFDFVLPVIGFDQYQKYVIIDQNKDSLFKWLQCVQEPSLAFPIISVSSLDIDYTIDLPDNVVEKLGIESIESLLIMNITSIPQNNPKGTTINLLAPLIFNIDTNLAGQIVLSGSGYNISFPMFKED